MKASQFCYWLQGYFEIQGESKEISADQANVIKRHLDMVFKHELDAEHGDEDHQAALQAIHDGDQPPGDIVMRC